MLDSEQQPEIEAPDELLADMPLPSDAKTFFLGGIFVLLMLTAAYVASEIVLPMIFAVMLNLLMQPALRALERLRTPRALGALLLILVVIATIVGLGAAISEPAEAWIAKLPEGVPRILERLKFLDAPINTLRTFLAAANNFGAAGPQRSSPGPLDGGAIFASVFAGTRSFASGLFTTVLFLYFLLVSGDSFLRRLVEVLPRFASKRQAVDISQQIGRDISAYLVTITLMNALVGAATAIVMWSTGVGDPVLWGTVAFILNYVPLLGPAAAFVIFLFAGSLTITSTWQALLPAALYGAIHVIEGETVTPMLLARRFTLNPVLVILSFVFWFWLWGVPGAILSRSILATTKIVCDRIRPLAASRPYSCGMRPRGSRAFLARVPRFLCSARRQKRQPRQRGQRLRPGSLHDRGAVVLDRALADAEVGGDVLARLAREHPFHHVPLSRRESSKVSQR